MHRCRRGVPRTAISDPPRHRHQQPSQPDRGADRSDEGCRAQGRFLAGVPVEIRAISNAVRSDRRVDDAFAAIVAATPALVMEIASCVS
jgi:hypothetical protein